MEEFDDIYEDDLDDFDNEFLQNSQGAMILQVYNNMGEVDDIYVGYERIKRFIDGIK